MLPSIFPGVPILGERLSDSQFPHLYNGPPVEPCLTWAPCRRDGTPDEPDGRPAAQLGHEYLGTDHLPAGHLPRLGRPPLSQLQHCHPAWLTHISDPLSPSELSSGWAPPGGFGHPLCCWDPQWIKQFFSVIQCTASKGDFQWSTGSTVLLSRIPTHLPHSSGSHFLPVLLPEKQAPLSLC